MRALRTIFFFLLLVGLLRLLGKRQVGQMEPSEFAVALLIAELAVIPIEDPGISPWRGIVPMASVFAAERVLSILSFRSIRLRRLLCGTPVILVENGRPVEENLRKTRVNLDELRGKIRREGILELKRVQYAILETDGSLTVFPFPRFAPASAADAGIKVPGQELSFSVVCTGRILEENLHLAGRDRDWLEHFLAGKRCRLSQVLLLTVTPSGHTELWLRQD